MNDSVKLFNRREILVKIEEIEENIKVQMKEKKNAKVSIEPSRNHKRHGKFLFRVFG